MRSCEAAHKARPAKEAGSLDLDFDVGSRDAHVMARNGVVCWVLEHRASPDVEFGAMPGTGHLMTLDFSPGQWPFLMRAGIVESEEFAVDIEQGNLLTLEDDQFSLAGRDLACARGVHEFAHGLISLRFKRLRFRRRSDARGGIINDLAAVDGEPYPGQ